MRVYRERGVEAASTELYQFVDLDQAKWAVLASVIALANAEKKIEHLLFDQEHFDNGKPPLH